MVRFGADTAGGLGAQRFEADIYDCEVEGEIPLGLNGVFIRMHGDWLYPPKYADDSFIAPEGYVSSFRFEGGVVDYKGRWVRNERFRSQLAARRQLYGYYRNPYTDDPTVADVANPHRRTTSNTTPVILGGRLYATKEDGLPHELDPNTLETLGPSNFGGRWTSQTFTAHPKVDPLTGETIAFGYEAAGLASREILLCTFDSSGTITHEVRFEAPYASMMHDMCITQSHVILPGGGLVTSPERLQAGQIHWGWDPTLPAFYGIIPRGGEAKDVRWFKGPSRGIIHTANARTEGDKVIMEAPMTDTNYWGCFPDIHGEAFHPARHLIRRLTFDLGSKDDRCSEEVLFPNVATTSFTRVDDRFTSLEYRHAYCHYSDPNRAFDGSRGGRPTGPINNCIGKFHVHDGAIETWFAGDTHSLMEVSFAPRPGSSEEGDGWLLAVADNLAERRSELVIVDAPTMEEVGRVILPFRSGKQIHGVWAGAHQLALTPLHGRIP